MTPGTAVPALSVSAARTKERSDQTRTPSRRAATMDALKIAVSYALGRLERTMVPAHHNYQVRLKRFLESKGVSAEWERDFVDVRFQLEGDTYIGEIKVTTTLRLEEAFRTALGQLLEYGFLRFEDRTKMVMFLDKPLDEKRLALANQLGIAVVCEVEDRFTLLGREVSGLAKVFDGRELRPEPIPEVANGPEN